MATKKDRNDYMRIYMLNRYKRRMKEAIEFLGGVCAECPVSTNLEIDHKDPTQKEYPIAKVWSYSEKKFWTEIKKCQLLCEKHHIKKTVEERGQKLAKGTHGTLSSYRYCKCEKCKEAKRNYSKTYMQNYRRKPVKHSYSGRLA